MGTKFSQSRIGAFIVLCLASIILGTGPVRAASGQGAGEAVIVSRLSFFSVEDLDFGTILSSAAGGTVDIAPDGTRTATGVTPAGGLFQPARFAGRGTFNQIVSISMVATPITITRVGGTQTMRVGVFKIGTTTSAIVLTTAPQTFRIGAATGIFNFPVGAQLTLGPNQADGLYQGTFSITLNYQ